MRKRTSKASAMIAWIASQDHPVQDPEPPSMEERAQAQAEAQRQREQEAEARWYREYLWSNYPASGF